MAVGFEGLQPATNPIISISFPTDNAVELYPCPVLEVAFRLTLPSSFIHSHSDWAVSLVIRSRILRSYHYHSYRYLFISHSYRSLIIIFLIRTRLFSLVIRSLVLYSSSFILIFLSLSLFSLFTLLLLSLFPLSLRYLLLFG